MTLMYHIAYLDHDDKRDVNLDTIYSQTELSLLEVLRLFFQEISYGYLDEDYQNYTPKEILRIAVKELSVKRIDIHKVVEKEGKPCISRGSWRVEDAYRDVKRIEEIRSFIQEESEIKLSSHALYGSQPMDWDDIMINVRGVERFLFTYTTPETDVQEDVFFENDIAYEHFLTGVETNEHDTFEIDIPLVEEKEILLLFQKWAKKVGIETSGKTVRFSNETEFQVRPIIDSLKQQMEQDPDRVFTIPSKYMFGFTEEEIPPKEKLAAQLNQEPPGTIACVIDEFKDETLLYLVNAIEDEQKRKKVIELLPQIPCTSLEKRLRYQKLFVYEPSLIKERLEKLSAAYFHIIEKENHTRVEKDIIHEYQFWTKIQLN